ncbi:hypothetical protein C5167_018383 [Papaver somniferum]|uniref:Ribosomal eL28/Mak16 domain-containing protein n=1 Tax=Papaver somniferum TaxID=3469 RepID=A0A4Y7IR60_PAPSO|nr:hypothetical protein C5167_018383 [Papaver somniferum]
MKRNDVFLVKEFGNGNQMVQFSKEPNNLYNVNTFKHFGLATAKTISVQAGKDSGVVLATIKTNKQKYPSALEKLSERVLELPVFPEDDVLQLLLGIGCGSGLSGETLSEWTARIGLDISDSMEVEGDLLLSDMGQVAQGCRLDIGAETSVQPASRHFLDHYIGVNPESNDQLELILGFAKRAGFVGGVVVDFSTIGRGFLDTKTLTVEEEDKKQSMFTGLHKLKGMIYKENYAATNRKSSKRRIEESGLNLEEAVPCIALSRNDTYVMSATGGKISLFNMTYKVMTTFVPPPPASTYVVKPSNVVFDDSGHIGSWVHDVIGAHAIATYITVNNNEFLVPTSTTDSNAWPQQQQQILVLQKAYSNTTASISGHIILLTEQALCIWISM